MSGEAKIAGVGQLECPRREPHSAARELRDLRGEHRLGCGLQVSGVAVVPAAVQTPDVADDELGLVVYGLQIRPVGERRGRLHGVEQFVETRAAVEKREGLFDQ